jgi:L-ascorbate metabolism protein UlaG (beta-lactamase superfamily)
MVSSLLLFKILTTSIRMNGENTIEFRLIRHVNMRGRKLTLLKRTMVFVGIIIGLVLIGGYLFMQQPVFGEDPSGKFLQRITQSKHYNDGAFQNIQETSVMHPDGSYFKLIKEAINKPSTTVPSKVLPSVKNNLKALVDEPSVVWFGHSSYMISIQQKRFLIDPVFSGYASPVPIFGKSFQGSDIYTVDDFPMLDAIFITHDHYDHLDYKTISKFIPKVKHFYVALGVGSHLRSWGVDERNITELDWWETVKLNQDISLTATPARHFSGRGFKRGKTLWVSYVLKTCTHNFYLGGDSGYSTSFKEIGDAYGPFDLALLECGQYNTMWPQIHMMPEEVVQASIDLKAKRFMPVHWGKFVLANHPWNEPIIRVTKEAARLQVPVVTPRIGEIVSLDSLAVSQPWWTFEEDL